MDNTALIFGAGKTGRGFAAHLAFLGGYRIVLIDKNKQLVKQLKDSMQYHIQVLGDEERTTTILLSGVYHIDDDSWHDELLSTHLVFTAVFGNNLEALAKDLAGAFRKRYKENPFQVLTVITCENITNAATFLKENVLEYLKGDEKEWLLEEVGFCESIVFRTCLDADIHQPPLTIRAQNFFELPCDGDAMKEELHVVGLKPVKNFQNQLRRKIYTYNCINAVIAYLGARKGYQHLNEAARDEMIEQVARSAAAESAQALVAEYGFESGEQQEWVRAALLKFADLEVPDPIDRNAVDPIRKLGRDDRLVGPALLALKHGIHPTGLLEGIVACMEYRDPVTNSSVLDLVKTDGIQNVLSNVCCLKSDEELFKLIEEEVGKIIEARDFGMTS